MNRNPRTVPKIRYFLCIVDRWRGSGCYDNGVKVHSRRIVSTALLLSIVLLFAAPFSPVSAQTNTVPLPIPTCAIAVNPSNIIVGGSIQVKWTSMNAVSGSITHIGGVSRSGAINLLPSSAARTDFVGTFTGPGGSATCSGSVTVTTTGTGGTGGGTYGTGGTYEIGGGNATLPPQPTTAPTYDAGGTYTPGGNYTAGGTYQPTTYTVNQSSFTTQPKNNSFTQTQKTVTSGNGNGGGGGISELVPCGNSKSDLNAPKYADDATSCNICSLGQLSQNIINFMLMIAIPISAALFAYAGILYFSSATNPSKAKDAKKIFSSVFIGFVIALSGYLIVQTMLNALLSDSFKTGGWRWDTLRCDGTRARHSDIGQIFTGLFQPKGGGTFVSKENGAVNGGIASGKFTGSLCADGNPACSVAALQAAGFTDKQAAVMSCIAITESSGNPASRNTSQGSTACGTFQIVQTNWNNPKLHTGNCSSATSCTDAGCNIQSANLLMQNRIAAGQSAFQDWTCPSCNNNASKCAAQYGQ